MSWSAGKSWVKLNIDRVRFDDIYVSARSSNYAEDGGITFNTREQRDGSFIKMMLNK